MKLVVLILKNLARNKVRTGLTALSIFFLVAVLTLILTVLRFLEDSMAEKDRDIKLIITERYDGENFSWRFMEELVRPGTVCNDELRAIPGFQAEHWATWNFIGFSLEKQVLNQDLTLFAIATQPEQFLPLTDGLESLPEPQEMVRKMAQPPVSRMPNTGIILGHERLQKLGKKVGDVFKVYCFTHRDPQDQPLEFELEIVGALPATSRWTTIAFMDVECYKRALQVAKHRNEGKVDLGWLLVRDQKSANEVARVIGEHLPRLKSETLSSAMNRFLEPFKDLLFGIKWLLVPAIFVTMTVIVANAIGITVRERQKEIAVLKVLGFRAWMIGVLILGEGLAIGIIAGFLGSATTYAVVNAAGVEIPIGFFPLFFVPNDALWWGPVTGGFTAFIGSFLPALGAQRVKVVEVFSKVA